MELPSSYNLNKKERGFTLLEVVLVLALCSLLLTLGFFMSVQTLKGTYSRTDHSVIVSFLQAARSRAMSNIEQSSYGVCFIAPNYVLFKGAVCTTDATVESSPANPMVASRSDFSHTFGATVFTQLSGTTTGATITMLEDGRVRVIVITHEGNIIW